MNIVAVIRRPEALDLAVQKLATRQGITGYEARTRLSGDLPRIVAILADANAADELMRGLNADGFLAALIPAARIERDDDRDMIASLGFSPSVLEVTTKKGETRAIPYDELSLILHGVRYSTTTVSREEKVKKFSPGRAIMTGGLMTSTTSSVTSTSTNETREAFLYLREVSGGLTMALYERRTNYSFLGTAMGPSSYGNFQTVLRELTRRAPGARVEGRLARPAGLGTLPLPPPGADPSEWKNDVAVAVLSLALP